MNKHQDDQSGDIEYWEERDEGWKGDKLVSREWDTGEHLAPPHGSSRQIRPRRSNARPSSYSNTQPVPRFSQTQPVPRRRSAMQPSSYSNIQPVSRFSDTQPIPRRRSVTQQPSFRQPQTDEALGGFSNNLSSSRHRTKFHFPGGRRGIALLVGLLGTALLLGGIYNLTLWSSSRAYTPLGANQTLVEQVCIKHAEANDTYITITPYDQEQNLSSTHPKKIYDTGNTFTAQLDITHIPIPWFLNWLRIPNGYQVSNNINQPLESNNWLLQTSSVTVALNLNIGNGQINLYNLVITDQGASFQRVPLTSGSCK